MYSKIILANHGGSQNHGCEALVRSLISTLSLAQSNILYSHNKEQDIFYNLNKKINIENSGDEIKRGSLPHIANYFVRTIFNTNIILTYRKNKNLLRIRDKIALSIGGDNYCYGEHDVYAYINNKLNKNNNITALIGCSIEPDLLKDKEVVEDMKRYSLITARESITYNALLEAGVKDNVRLIPDSAFILDTQECKLPDDFIAGNTVGINVSPLVQRLEKGDNITFRNFENLIQYIIDNTDMNIALIPHVVWNNNNDLEPLTALYNRFKNTDRVCLIDEKKTLNCMQLKYVISKCRFIVAARTHASIAAYSSCTPTLVVGYSVKAKGIAKDLFGGYDNYVIPVQGLKDEKDVQKGFQWLQENEKNIKEHLQKIMPEYKNRVYALKDEIEKINTKQ